MTSWSYAPWARGANPPSARSPSRSILSCSARMAGLYRDLQWTLHFLQRGAQAPAHRRFIAAGILKGSWAGQRAAAGVFRSTALRFHDQRPAPARTSGRPEACPPNRERWQQACRGAGRCDIREARRGNQESGLALVHTHPFRLSQDVAFHGAFQFMAAGPRLQIQECVQGK